MTKNQEEMLMHNLRQIAMQMDDVLDMVQELDEMILEVVNMLEQERMKNEKHSRTR